MQSQPLRIGTHIIATSSAGEVVEGDELVIVAFLTKKHATCDIRVRICEGQYEGNIVGWKSENSFLPGDACVLPLAPCGQCDTQSHLIQDYLCHECRQSQEVDRQIE
jgi:hypothetical protein